MADFFSLSTWLRYTTAFQAGIHAKQFLMHYGAMANNVNNHLFYFAVVDANHFGIMQPSSFVHGTKYALVGSTTAVYVQFAQFTIRSSRVLPVQRSTGPEIRFEGPKNVTTGTAGETLDFGNRVYFDRNSIRCGRAHYRSLTNCPMYIERYTGSVWCKRNAK